MKRYTVIFERDEDGARTARVPSLQGCHAHARTWDELHARLDEVIALCLGDQVRSEVPC